MKKTLRTLLLVASAAVLVLGTLLFAACVPMLPVYYRLEFETFGGTEIPAIVAEEGDPITPPDAPVKAGFIFDGWYLNADCQGFEEEIPTVMPGEDRVYYAKYVEAEKYTVTFDANAPADAEVLGTMAPQTFYEATEQALDLNAYVVKGHLFLGWAKSADGEVEVEDGEVLLLTESITLYAVWQGGGIANEFNDDDFLFLEGTKATLVKDGVQYVGTYDEATGTFDVEEFSGRVFEDGKFACYGDHALDEYTLADETLALFDSGIATFNGTNGHYSYDEENDWFVFAAEGVNFTFRVGTDGGDLVFFKQGAEVGEYASVAGQVLVLDGFGGAKLDATSYTYAATDDANVFTLSNGGKFRLSGETFALYNAAAEGTFHKEGADSLVLDGYDVAQLGNDKGTYVVVTLKVEGTFVRVTLGGTETLYKLDADTYSDIGEEVGEYNEVKVATWYYGGSMVLDGFGGAKYKPLSTTYTGTYTYDPETDVYTFNYDNGTAPITFKLVPHTNGREIACLVYDAAYAGEYTNANSNGDKVEFDGYGVGVYTVSGKEPVSGWAKFSGTTSVTLEPFDKSANIVLTLNASNHTFSMKDESGEYGLSTNRGSLSSPRDGDMKLKLDGAGNATIYKAEEDWFTDRVTYSSYATGTYALVEGSDSIWVYTPVTYQSRVDTFRFKLSGSYYYLEDTSLAHTYTAGDAELSVDGFGNVTYKAADGEIFKGSKSSADSGFLAFTDQSGNAHLFKLEGDTFTEIGTERGTYTLADHETLVLDGEGNATLGEIEGTYTANAEGFTFVSDGLTFNFRLDGSKYVIAFENADEYIGAYDFTRLTLGGYGEATYINEFGVPTHSTYVMLSEHIARFTVSYNTYMYFRLNYEARTFALVEDDFVVDGNLLVVYLGADANIVIPEEVEEIGVEAFKNNSIIVSVDLKNVKIIGASVFENCTALTSVEGNMVAKIGNKAFYNSTNLNLILHGTVAPAMGNEVFSNSAKTLVIADTLEIALSWFVADTWAVANLYTTDYVNRLAYDTTVDDTYHALNGLGSSNLIALKSGRAVKNNMVVGLYAFSAEAITFYKYSNAEALNYSTQVCLLTNGTFEYDGRVYAASGSVVTYIDADENTLVITLGDSYTATFNGEPIELTLSDTYGTLKFTLTAEDGYDYEYTVKYSGGYSADSTLTGTFEATSEFKAVEFELNGEDGQSIVYIKMSAPGVYSFSKNSYLVVNGSRTTIYASDVTVTKTEAGFNIFNSWEQTSVRQLGLFELTVADDNTFTYTFRHAEAKVTPTVNSGSASNVGISIFKATDTGEVLHAILRLPSYDWGTSLSDATTTYVVQEDGSWLFTVSSPSWAAGKQYKVVFDEDATSCTITEITE